ncbi:putative Cell division cycle protein [Helianthus annuus]|uniref:Cell division cycle protein n=1 Tax=Helianthus annuus TaxID=4232 RepID=A0A251SZZ8_HELAN|nr:cell division cycle protein 123 homolog [Helianthus annuus]XP_021997089.1 cell division cycle protein 123 homolog [Helianthus annuus]XP_035836699.1 cell division cycle protein 123 homolog [Helianthus annuus]KAF5776870.1 putative Cell division cycle protein [Helianthus annuus]KAJ0492031.1 putative Cell division cycle protein [Helianthus annuus]KAJ0504347.1 putative Cell division cycle protein [Helianthus annuus]KAJ0674058.1 putative Cell division cycle protein [Helianthus annuus]KAJ0861709
MKEEELNRCQIQEWYPRFKSTSIKTVIHELPESFINYLLDDSGPFLLPLSVSDNDALPNRIHNPEDEQDYTITSDNESEQTSPPPPPPPSFPELESQINESIKTLGGAIFPKLNWSSPKDSAWISPNASLKCTSFSEITLLLKSSDSLVHDLCHAYDSCTNCNIKRPARFFLALRKWYPSLHPEMEFRVFVRNHVLVGISQREVTGFYPSLTKKKPVLESLIKDFYSKKVNMKFESESYTFDVYVRTDDEVKLLDFNPWCEFTLPLLFTWEELESELLSREPELRIVEGQCGVRPGLKTAVPYDYLDTSEGSGWDQFLRNADEELRRQTRSAGG